MDGTQEVREVFLKPVWRLKEHFTSKSTRFAVIPVLQVVLHSQPQRSCLKAQLKNKKNAFDLRWSVPLMHLFNVPVFPRSHNSLFTWTCCLFLSLSVPSSVRTREVQRSADVQWIYCYSVIYGFFFLKHFYFYLFSLILDSVVFTSQMCWTNKVVLEFVRGIYTSAASEHVVHSWTNSFTLNFFIIISLKWPHLITVIMFKYWDHTGPRDLQKKMLHIL